MADKTDNLSGWTKQSREQIDQWLKTIGTEKAQKILDALHQDDPTLLCILTEENDMLIALRDLAALAVSESLVRLAKAKGGGWFNTLFKGAGHG